MNMHVHQKCSRPLKCIIYSILRNGNPSREQSQLRNIILANQRKNAEKSKYKLKLCRYSSEPVDKMNNIQRRKDKQSSKKCLAFATDRKIHFCLLICLLTVSYSFVFCMASYRNIKLFVSRRQGGLLILMPFYS